jgi:tRNA dimethylallyltransferase
VVETWSEKARAGVVALAGPTAVGKSEVALLLAEKFSGEIISFDSMQVYRGMDIGTAKPSPADRARIAHHLIDVVELTSSFDVAQFLHQAQRAVQDVQARGRLPILCGGTGLYFKAFFHGLGESPGTTPKLRTELENTPLPELLSELAERDPATYQRIDRQNSRRVIRAIEVIRLTGKPYSEQRAEWARMDHGSPAAPMFGLSRSSADLRQRIDTRVHEMFDRGLVEETRRLLNAGLAQNRTALQALGYRQVVEHLDGVRSLEETIALVKIRTAQFAKRQLTWFRHQLPIKWITISPADHPLPVANQIIQTYNQLNLS